MKIKDTRGRESITLTFVTIAIISLIGKFWIEGATLGPLGTISTMSATEFGIAFAAILAPWLHREWVEKKNVQSD